MKKTILTILAMVSIHYITFAQNTKVFEGIPRTLNESQLSNIDKDIGNSIVFDFPITEFNAYLKSISKDEETTIDLKIGNKINLNLTLAENDIRSQDLIQSRSSATGSVDIENQRPVNTYKGIVNNEPNNWIRWYISDTEFTGMIVLQDRVYQFEKLDNSNSELELEGAFLLTQTDRTILEGLLDESQLIETSTNGAEDGAKTATDPTRWLQLAAEVDFEFYNAFGQDENAVMTTLEARVNLLDGLYQSNVGMAVVLVFVNIWESNNDPYTGNANTIWNQLRSHWNGNYECIRRDVVHLFTGRTGFGASGGVNAEGQKSICGCDDDILVQLFPDDKNAFAYGWSTNASGINSWLTTAHELGHNLGAIHDCSDIMCGGPSCTCSSSPEFFSSANITRMNNYFGGLNYNYCNTVGPCPFVNDVCLGEPNPDDLIYNEAVKQEKEQLAGLGFTSGFDLPTQSEISTYNFGTPDLTAIPNVTVNDGGKLRINGVGPTGFLDGPNTSQEVFNAATARCGSTIVINSGGEMILGNEDGNVNIPRKANVRINRYSKILVKNGGTLKLARGSKLIIEEGARLDLEAGAKIRLWWSESAIEINGDLSIYGDLDFGGSGFFQFEPKHNINFVGNAGFTLHGQGDRFIRLKQGTVLDIGNRKINLKSGSVEFEDETQIRIGPDGSAEIVGVDFNGIQSGYDAYAFYAENAEELEFSFCNFNDLYVGIYAKGIGSNSFVKTTFCDFNNVLIGLFAEDYSKFDLRYTDFQAGGIGLDAVWVEGLDLLNMISCTIQDYNNGQINVPSGPLNLRNVNHAKLIGSQLTNNMFGATLFNVHNFEMKGGSIKRSGLPEDSPTEGTIGIYAPQAGFTDNYTNILLHNGASIQNYAKGIWIGKGGFYDNGMYGRVTMDCAKLINNNQGITGQDIPLSIDALTHCNCTDPSEANPNSFVHNLGSNNNQLFFDICYDDLAMSTPSINAKVNYWGGGLPSPNIDYIFDVVQNFSPCDGNNDLVVDVSGATSLAPTNCNNGPVPPPGDSDTKSAKNYTSGNEDVIIYPNPARDEVMVRWDKIISNGKLRLISLTGKKIFEQDLVGLNQIKINTSKLPKGIYFVEILANDFNSSHKLVLE